MKDVTDLIQPGKSKGFVWPFAHMTEPGDMFFVRSDQSKGRSMNVAACTEGKMSGRRYAVFTVRGGWRVFLVELPLMRGVEQ